MRLHRQEHHADAVLARRRQREAELAHSRAKNSCGIWIRIPAPSPVSGSQPQAPRCVRLIRIWSPCSMMSWDFSPRMLATKPMPQASCSLFGS